MTEKVISTRRGTYGVLNVTLPLHVKLRILDYSKKLGYKKAEFLRLVLMTGFDTLSKSVDILAEGENVPSSSIH